MYTCYTVLRISPSGYHSEFDQGFARHDGTAFEKDIRALSAYTKGVLIANAAREDPHPLLGWCVAFFC